MIQSIVVLILFFIALYAMLRWFERANVWQPRRDIVSNPNAIGMPYDEVHFKAPDDTTLHGWYIPADSATASILICHGNGGNISHRLDTIRQFHSLSLNVFIFDYRGYGKSEGRLSEAGTYEDTLAAYDWLASRASKLPLIIFGRSLGAALATYTASNRQPAALICESGFSSIPGIGKDLFPFLPVQRLSKISYNTKEFIKKINCPVLVIHSPEDELIPFHHGQALFEAAPAPKAFYELKGGHNEGYLLSEKDYLARIKSFLREHTSITWKNENREENSEENNVNEENKEEITPQNSTNN